MNNVYRFLNIPFDLFDQKQVEATYTDVVTTTQNNPAGRQVRLLTDTNKVYNAESYKWFENLGCYLHHGHIFYSRPGGILPWHNDGELGDYVKLNFVWGSDNHLMYFGEPKNIRKKPLSQNASGNNYQIFAESELQNIISVQINKPFIFNGDIPHEVRNFGSTGRWCLSTILYYKGNRLLWNDALNIFKEYIINE